MTDQSSDPDYEILRRLLERTGQLPLIVEQLERIMIRLAQIEERISQLGGPQNPRSSV